MSWDKKEEEKVKVESFFKSVTELPPVEGLKVGIYGAPNTGKTHFSLTAPEPVFVIDTEFGARLPAKNLKKEKIFIFEALQLDPETNDIDPIKSLEKIEEALRAIIGYIQDHPDERGTIVLDSASDIWQWIGIWLEESPYTKKKDDMILRFEWGKANKRYLRLIHKLLRSQWNVVLTGKTQDVYDAEGKPVLGRVKPRWQKDTEYWLDIILKSDIIYPQNKVVPVRRFTIMKCRAWNLTGTLTNPSWNDLVKFIEEKVGIKIL
ncbi:MAG: AAA family ATPase [Candidatus Thorarchaeota archaeon]